MIRATTFFACVNKTRKEYLHDAWEIFLGNHVKYSVDDNFPSFKETFSS